MKQQWVIPKANSAFVAAMEDVLAVYTRPRDTDIPLVCLDETWKQLIAETRAPVPSGHGGEGGDRRHSRKRLENVPRRGDRRDHPLRQPGPMRQEFAPLGHSVIRS